MRGLGDWPLGSRLSQRQMITMVCSERPGSFSSAATHPRPSPDLSPQRGGERGSPQLSTTRRTRRSPRRRRHRRPSTRNGAARKFAYLQVIEKSRNQKILASPSPTGAARADAACPAGPWAVPQPRIGGERSPSDARPSHRLPPRIDKLPPFGLPARRQSKTPSGRVRRGVSHSGAEGATAPETLRPMDRWVMTLWKAVAARCASAHRRG